MSIYTTKSYNGTIMALDTTHVYHEALAGHQSRF